MQALWLEEQNLQFREDVPIPEPAAGQALIRVRLSGICSTDLELVRGYLPFMGVPGHEFVGEVVSSPSDPSWEGMRVVGEINIVCGDCYFCRSGMASHCEKRKTLGIHDWNGVFSEYLVLPLANLHVVPAFLPDELAVFTEPLAAACEILEQVRFRHDDRVLVIGAGRLGQLVAQVFKNTGCKLEVVARHHRQQQLLADRAIPTIAKVDLSKKKYDLVIEATGSADGFKLARQVIRPRGMIVLKSTYTGSAKVNFSGIVVDEVKLVGSRCGPFEPALHLLSQHRVNPMPLIDGRYPLKHGVEAFKHAGQPGALKILIQPG